MVHRIIFYLCLNYTNTNATSSFGQNTIPCDGEENDKLIDNIENDFFDSPIQILQMFELKIK